MGRFSQTNPRTQHLETATYDEQSPDPIPALDRNIPQNSNAEILADVFEKQFTSAVEPMSQIKLGMAEATNTLAALLGETIAITERHNREQLNRLSNKAPGPDKIPNFVLKFYQIAPFDLLPASTMAAWLLITFRIPGNL